MDHGLFEVRRVRGLVHSVIRQHAQSDLMGGNQGGGVLRQQLGFHLSDRGEH
jgi:hypothetical protein